LGDLKPLSREDALLIFARQRDIATGRFGDDIELCDRLRDVKHGHLAAGGGHAFAALITKLNDLRER
jgi:hypothetical protein